MVRCRCQTQFKGWGRGGAGLNSRTVPTPDRVTMPQKSASTRKPVGDGPPGRKSEMSTEQDEFLASYADRFKSRTRHSAFYREVVNAFIEKFSFGLVTKSGFTLEELRLDVKDLESLAQNEKERVIERRQEAKQAIHNVSYC